VNKSIIKFPRGDIILAGAGPNISPTFLRILISIVEITFEITVNRGKHPIATNVKFSTLVELRPLNIFLQDKGTMMEIIHICCKDFFDLIESRTNLDAIASVCVLAGFDYPYVINVILLSSFRF
jgi:hypothetical protein